jgi:hypothetical protein
MVTEQRAVLQAGSTCLARPARNHIRIGVQPHHDTALKHDPKPPWTPTKENRHMPGKCGCPEKPVKRT